MIFTRKYYLNVILDILSIAFLLLCYFSLAEFVAGRSLLLQLFETNVEHSADLDNRGFVSIIDCATRCLELPEECDYVVVSLLVGQCLFFDHASILQFSPSSQELRYKDFQRFSDLVNLKFL